MALSANDYNEIQKEDKGLLDISASEFYFDKVRPHIQDILLTCKTDPELIRTLDKAINAGDSFCARKEYGLLVESFEAFNKVAGNQKYFSGIIKQASEEEKNKIRKLTELVNDLRIIVQCEKPAQPKEVEAKDRIDYNSPIGEIKGEGYNKGHLEHNITNLSKPIPKDRIPNV